MRKGGRALLAVLAGAGAALLLPGTALAVNPPRVPVAQRFVPVSPPARSLATVDHPPADGVSSVDSGDRAGHVVALTFDADMTQGMLQQLRAGTVRSWYNREVRDLLDTEQVPATIFLTGLWAATYPEEARSLAGDRLFEIGNHSFDHQAFRMPCYGLTGTASRLEEMAAAQTAIESATGVRPALFRFPGDCYDSSDVAMARSLGLLVVSGDVRGNDAFNGSAATIVTTVLTRLQPGSIVVLHLQGGPNAPMTASALRQLIPAIRARGYTFATVSQLLAPAARGPAADGVAVLARYRQLPLKPPPARLEDLAIQLLP